MIIWQVRQTVPATAQDNRKSQIYLCINQVGIWKKNYYGEEEKNKSKLYNLKSKQIRTKLERLEDLFPQSQLNNLIIVRLKEFAKIKISIELGYLSYQISRNNYSSNLYYQQYH